MSATKFRSKKEFVYESLKEQILSGQLLPQTRLIIDDLSRELGVSPIPVREALQQLQSDNLVKIEPYVGARVAEIHKESVQEVFALLEVTELLSARAACSRMTEENFEQLEQLIQQMDESLDDLEVWSAQNVKLHKLICDYAEMSLVASVMGHVVDHWNRLRRLYLDTVFVDRVHAAQKDHWELLNALRTRDADAVEAAIRKHNQQAVAGYLEYLSAEGDQDDQRN